jgi:bifunctional non-homologous end joining protein LigD
VAEDQVHYDLMLEQEDVLKTWRLNSVNFSQQLVIRESFDHRKIYLDFEGVLSKNRGKIEIWDKGEYKTKAKTQKEWVVEFKGSKINGKFMLKRLKEREWIMLVLGGKSR